MIRFVEGSFKHESTHGEVHRQLAFRMWDRGRVIRPFDKDRLERQRIEWYEFEKIRYDRE